MVSLIYNTSSNGNITITNGLFNGNWAKTTGATGSQGTRGGAISNWYSGIITLIDTNFTNNVASSERASFGARIYNNAATTNIIAQNKDVVFENNRAGTDAQVTYDTEGNVTGATGGDLKDVENATSLNLKATDGKSITFGGEIGGAGTTNIGELSSAYTGTVNFNNNVSQGTINLNSGTMHLGIANAISNVGTFNNNGCTLDTITNAIENQTLGSTFNLNNNLDWNMEVALNYATKGADFLDTGTFVNSGANTIQLSTIKVLTDADKRYTKTYISDDTLKDQFALKSGYSLLDKDGNALGANYSVELNKDTSGAYLLFNNSDIKNLVTAVRYNDAPVVGGVHTYTLTTDENIATDITNLGDVDDTTRIGTMVDNLTINGGGYGIIGGGKSGIHWDIVRTLTINNVGSLNADGTVNKAWQGFVSPYEGGVLRTFANGYINNSVFYNNSAVSGGAIAKITTGNMVRIENSAFVGNKATSSGGAIWNTGLNLSITGSISPAIMSQLLIRRLRLKAVRFMSAVRFITQVQSQISAPQQAK